MMKVFIGADHRGFELKGKLIEWLKDNDYQTEDCGAFQPNPTDDYPDFAKAVAERVASEEGSRGIVICGSGAGVNIVANKIKGVRCSVCFDVKQVSDGRQHDDLNVLALASNFIDEQTAKHLVKTFLETAYEPTENHNRRIEKIKSLEN